MQPTAEALEALLPQTQCQACGYQGCRPYAEAMTQGAPLTGCAPGGEHTLTQIAAQFGRVPTPQEIKTVRENQSQTTRVWIDKDACIGCTKCISACPVDAIVGAPKWLHDVLPSECTGCELCLPVCPVDCMHPVVESVPAWSSPAGQARSAYLKARYEQRHERLIERDQQKMKHHRQAKHRYADPKQTMEARQALLAQALAKTKQRYDEPQREDDA